MKDASSAGTNTTRRDVPSPARNPTSFIPQSPVAAADSSPARVPDPRRNYQREVYQNGRHCESADIAHH